MDPENLHKDLPENLPEDSSREPPDTNESKLRKSLEAASALKKAQPKSNLIPVLYMFKDGVRQLVDAKNSLSKWLDSNKDRLRTIKRGFAIWVTSIVIISIALMATDFVIKKQLAAEETGKISLALDEEKSKRPLIAEGIQSKPGLPKKPTLPVVLAIAFVVGGIFLYLFGSRFQLLKNPIKGAIALVTKEQVPEGQPSEFKRLEDISSTLLGGLLLKGFMRRGYEVSLTSGITSGRLTCVLKRENEKVLFRYIICKEEDDFGRAFVKDLAKSMKEEKADKGYLVTTGAVAEPALVLAEENSIKLIGREKLEEFMSCCLLQESLMKKLDDTKAELAKQSKIAENEMAQKQTLSEKIKESKDMTTKLNDEKNALSEKAKTKEKEYSQLLRRHEDSKRELQRHKGELSGLIAARDSLQEENSGLKEKVRALEEQLANYKNSKEQLSKENKLLEGERNQRRQLEDKLRQSDKDLEQAMDLTDKLEEKLAQKEQEPSQKKIVLEKLSAQNTSKEAINKKEFGELKADHKILQQSLAEKEEALEEINEEKEMLDHELRAKDKSLSKLQNEIQSYEAEMEEATFPSLDLRPLADKGVLLKLEPEGPVAAVKRIAVSGVSFESERKLEIPSNCNITLIFFGSPNPLTIKSNLTWQKKSPGSSVYNIRLKFPSLEQSQSRRIHEYINITQQKAQAWLEHKTESVT